ncbi:MAG: glycosyltransferase family 4 protein [Nitrosarchaeum sp.]|nr:glycosyltransferase family 4 protein [Nitrosarchaeum sp.]
MILIVNDSIRGVVSDEETIWSRLRDNIPNAVGISTNSLTVPIKEKLDELKPSLILQNANLGYFSEYKTISFLQDPFIEMIKKCQPLSIFLRSKLRGRETYQDKLKKQKESLRNSIRVTNSNYMAHMYKELGEFTVIPLGVDSKLFRPMNKTEMREKYHIPKNKFVKIFVGSQHPVKGFDKIKKLINKNQDEFWILVLKDNPISNGKNYVVFNKISQNILAELYNCADLCVSKSITESFGLSLVEAMFCNIPIEVPKIGIFWDWDPDMKNPRESAFEKKLDMNSFIENWKNFIDKHLE